MSFNELPFACSIHIELYHHVLTSNSIEIWYIQANYNGTPVVLNGCNGKTKCPLRQFLKHLQGTLYNYDVRKACEATYKPSDPPSGPID